MNIDCRHYRKYVNMDMSHKLHVCGWNRYLQEQERIFNTLCEGSHVRFQITVQLLHVNTLLSGHAKYVVKSSVGPPEHKMHDLFCRVVRVLRVQ